MANAITLKKQKDKLLNKLRKSTHFCSKLECENLSKKFDEVNNGQKIPREKFRDFLGSEFGVTDDKLLDRVFKVFDYKDDHVIDLEEWIVGLSVCLRGTAAEKTKFVFKVYDSKNRGLINRDEMFLYLKQSLDSGKQAADDDPDEGVSELIDMVRKKFNTSNTTEQTISLASYEETVAQDPLLMEFLGPCMPSEMHIDRFEKNIVQAEQHPW